MPITNIGKPQFFNRIKRQNMKTAAEFVTEYYQIDRFKIATVRIQSVIKCLERYTEYRETEVKKLGLPVVTARTKHPGYIALCKPSYLAKDGNIKGAEVFYDFNGGERWFAPIDDLYER